MFLRAPEEVVGKDGRVSAMRLQVMELGEADERGRRRPVPLKDVFEEIGLDSVIVAIGQKNDHEGFADLEQTRWCTIAADARNFSTGLAGVFACGDTVNDGAGIAIGAIAQANEAAKAVDAYLVGGEYLPVEEIVSEREMGDVDFAGRERIERVKMPHLPAEERRNNFREVNLGLSADAAMAEAKRCLECGCHDYAECRLIRYAKKLRTDCKRLRGEFHPGHEERKLVHIERNGRKCITCNLCVRVCEQKARKGLLGLVGRGFSTVIKPEFNDSGAPLFCRDCRLCVDACPTGALRFLV
jgi:formate dehydrogenase major subunit